MQPAAAPCTHRLQPKPLLVASTHSSCKFNGCCSADGVLCFRAVSFTATSNLALQDRMDVKAAAMQLLHSCCTLCCMADFESHPMVAACAELAACFAALSCRTAWMLRPPPCSCCTAAAQHTSRSCMPTTPSTKFGYAMCTTTSPEAAVLHTGRSGAL